MCRFLHGNQGFLFCDLHYVLFSVVFHFVPLAHGLSKSVFIYLFLGYDFVFKLRKKNFPITVRNGWSLHLSQIKVKNENKLWSSASGPSLIGQWCTCVFLVLFKLKYSMCSKEKKKRLITKQQATKGRPNWLLYYSLSK